ncbi:hypothetical protein [Metamycoplasma hominis]
MSVSFPKGNSLLKSSSLIEGIAQMFAIFLIISSKSSLLCL